MRILKSIKFWFVLSLAFNFLVLGVFIGQFDGRSGGGRPPVNEIGAVLRAMPNEARSDLQRQLRMNIDELRKAGQNFNAQKLADIIAIDPFDQEALVEAFNTQRLESESIAISAHDDIVAAISQLSPSERVTMAMHLREFDQARGKHGKNGERERR